MTLYGSALSHLGSTSEAQPRCDKADPYKAQSIENSLMHLQQVVLLWASALSL